MTTTVKKAVQKIIAPKPKKTTAKAAKGSPKKKVAAKGTSTSAKAKKPRTAAKKQAAKPAKKAVSKAKVTAKSPRTVKKTTQLKAIEAKEKKAVKKTTKPSSGSSSAKATKTVSGKAVPKKAAPKKQAARKTASKKIAPKKLAARSSASVNKTNGKKSPVKSVKSPSKVRSGKPIAKPEADELIKEFRKVVNLTPEELERRLSTPIAKKLGLRDAAQAGIVGHESGKRILAILTKSRRAYTDDDLRHMQIVVKYVRKRRSEKPPGDIFASNWRFSLLNWGHDPMRARRR